MGRGWGVWERGRVEEYRNGIVEERGNGNGVGEWGLGGRGRVGKWGSGVGEWGFWESERVWSWRVG